jgi:hypothetical protein
MFYIEKSEYTLCRQYNLSKNINLVIVLKNDENFIQSVKNKIHPKDHIDGIIYSSKTEPYEINIYIKDLDVLIRGPEVGYNYTKIPFKDYVTLWLLKEVNLIKRMRVTSKLYDNDFIRINL